MQFKLYNVYKGQGASQAGTAIYAGPAPGSTHAKSMFLPYAWLFRPDNCNYSTGRSLNPEVPKFQYQSPHSKVPKSPSHQLQVPNSHAFPNPEVPIPKSSKFPSHQSWSFQSKVIQVPKSPSPKSPCRHRLWVPKHPSHQFWSSNPKSSNCKSPSHSPEASNLN